MKTLVGLFIIRQSNGQLHAHGIHTQITNKEAKPKNLDLKSRAMGLINTFAGKGQQFDMCKWTDPANTFVYAVAGLAHTNKRFMVQLNQDAELDEHFKTFIDDFRGSNLELIIAAKYICNAWECDGDEPGWDE